MPSVEVRKRKSVLSACTVRAIVSDIRKHNRTLRHNTITAFLFFLTVRPLPRVRARSRAAGARPRSSLRDLRGGVLAAARRGRNRNWNNPRIRVRCRIANAHSGSSISMAAPRYSLDMACAGLRLLRTYRSPKRLAGLVCPGPPLRSHPARNRPRSLQATSGSLRAESGRPSGKLNVQTPTAFGRSTFAHVGDF